MTLLMTRTLSDISDLTLANRSHRIPTRVRSGRGSFPYRSLVEQPLWRPDCAAWRDTHNILTDTSPDLSWLCPWSPAPHPINPSARVAPIHRKRFLRGRSPKPRRRFGPERREDIVWLRGFASSSGDSWATRSCWTSRRFQRRSTSGNSSLADRQNMRTGALGLSNGSGADPAQPRLGPQLALRARGENCRQPSGTMASVTSSAALYAYRQRSRLRTAAEDTAPRDR